MTLSNQVLPGHQNSPVAKWRLDSVENKEHNKAVVGIEIKKKQWDLIEKVVIVLKDFAEVTDRLSYSSACVSEVGL